MIAKIISFLLIVPVVIIAGMFLLVVYKFIFAIAIKIIKKFLKGIEE